MRLSLLHNHGRPGVVAGEAQPPWSTCTWTLTTTHSNAAAATTTASPETHATLVARGHGYGMLEHSGAWHPLLHDPGLLRHCRRMHCGRRRLSPPVLLEEINDGMVVVVDPLARRLRTGPAAGEDRAHRIDGRRLYCW